jgi:Zn-dependent protease with chaperone function
MNEGLIPLVGAWLLTYLAHSTILLGAVAAIGWRLRGREGLLDLLWKIGLLGGILTATAQVIGLTDWLSGDGGVLSSPGRLSGLPQPLDLTVRAAEGGTGEILLTAGVMLWLSVALAGLLRLMIGHRELTRLLSDRVPASSHHLGWKLTLPPGTRYRVSTSGGIRSPMALGSGELCLPFQALELLSREELHAILSHELAHLDRRDPAWLWVSSVLTRVLFFQPLNWIAAHRVRAYAEFLCDDAAVRGSSRLAVASALAHASEWLESTRPATAVGMAGSESLTVERVRRVLGGVRPSNRDGGRLSWLPAFGFLILLAAYGPGIGTAILPGYSYTISAFDNGGSFAVTLQKGRVIGVMMDGASVPATGIHQRGNRVNVDGINGQGPLELRLTDKGGMQWTSRPRVAGRDS